MEQSKEDFSDERVVQEYQAIYDRLAQREETGY
jgi:DNA/RNA-binding domain of Phe-tRNA-synthetase-like protein